MNKSSSKLAEEYGVSRQVINKWKKRDILEDKLREMDSKRPDKLPPEKGEPILATILATSEELTKEYNRDPKIEDIVKKKIGNHRPELLQYKNCKCGDCYECWYRQQAISAEEGKCANCGYLTDNEGIYESRDGMVCEPCKKNIYKETKCVQKA